MQKALYDKGKTGSSLKNKYLPSFASDVSISHLLFGM